MLQPDTAQTRTLYKEKLADQKEVAAAIEKIANEIIEQFKDKNPLFVCLLRGGVPFATQLMTAVTKQDPHFYPELDYMTVSRYGDSREASEPQVVMDVSYKTTVADRPVIVLDDMIDKGGTYLFTKSHLEGKGAASVHLAVLIQRELSQPRSVNADFYCFSVASEEWLTGMGLDDSRLANEANRWADFIAIAN